MFRLKLFGSACIDGPGGPLTGRAVQRRRLALLALLAVARGRGFTRDKLVTYLWPDAESERARHQLSDSVYRINQATGGESITASGEYLRLNPQQLACDAWEFLDAVDAGDWRRAAGLHTAPFLDGFFLTDGDELERWADAQRERFSRELARALEHLAEDAERSGSDPDAVAWWRLLSSADPYSTRVAVRLMRALERTGERAAALQHAHAHTMLLEQNIGVAPDAELGALVAELRRPLSARGVDTDTGPPVVAVLPFLNLGTSPDTDYFTDGITEDIIAHLARIGALRVISRASVMPFRARDRTLAEIGAALGATIVLDGSVRRSGDRVRVVAQLIDVATDRHIWADTYDRMLTDVFAIQTDIALRIAAALQARLSTDETARINTPQTKDVRAYQLYLKGRHCLTRYTEEGLRQAIRHMEHALQLDPHYALAWAALAHAWTELGEAGVLTSDEAYARARHAARRAAALDADLAEVHCMLGHLKVAREFDWDGAEREFQRAIELSPSSADAWDLYGRMCQALGRYDEAAAMQVRAHELDPIAHRSDLTSTLLRAGRYDEALHAARRALAFDPNFHHARGSFAWALMLNGFEDEGIGELEKAVALANEHTAWLAQLGQAYAMTGRIEAAQAVLERLETMGREGHVSPYHLAYVHTGLGNHERAIDCLELACEQRAGAVYGVGGSFLFASLRAHPRFRALLHRMHLRPEQFGGVGAFAEQDPEQLRSD